MAKLAQLPADDRALEPKRGEVRRIPRSETRYFAFLSYSHKDDELAAWLHDELEEFRVPNALAGKLRANGIIPRRLTPIFRDEHELAAADDLGEEIEAALACSQFLIVLCSPDAARSHWTNAEIETFKRSRPDGCVLAAIAAGEPFASEIPGREHEECFPPALRQKFDRRGRPTAKRAEPLAADLRENGDGRRLGFLKLVAGMLGVGLDELVQRETTRRNRRLAWVAAASLAGMAVTSTLAITAIQARDSARDQRREAEGLVAFMLGDLKDKLEPIGRLDALDGVGARVLGYYSKQDASELSDAALLQRSRALSLMGEVANLRGDLGTAQRLYHEAADGTGEAVRRNPGDPQRLFDHAQNIYYFGDLAAQRGDFGHAEAAFREYRRLADRMVAAQPDNLKWRMEVQYAEANLGIVLLKQRRFADATRQFAGALQTIEAVAAVDPKSSDYQKSVAESIAWLSDAELAQGKLADAIARREQHVALLDRLSLESNGDVGYRQMLVAAHRALGRLLAAQGASEAAERHLRASASIADGLIPEEPGNTRWIDYGALSHLLLAQYSLTTGNLVQAETEARTGCGLVQKLLARDSTVVDWQADQQACVTIRAQLALRHGDAGSARALARQALAIANNLKSGDSVADRYLIARAQLVLGDAEQRGGDMKSAQAAWMAGLGALPQNIREQPWETGIRAELESRRGDKASAARRFAQLAAMGFKNMEVLKT